MRSGEVRRASNFLASHVATWVVTGPYFVPEIIRLSRAGSQLPTSELARRGRRWLKLSWGRHLPVASAWVAAAAALGRKQANVSEAADFARSADADSLDALRYAAGSRHEPEVAR